MMSQSPLVSAVVLNYRSGKSAVECVRALAKQTFADQMEIIVIDNHSKDDSIGILRNSLSRMPTVRIIETAQNGGFGFGYNHGITYARGTYLLINNPDKRPETEAVAMMVAAMEADPSIGILGPKMMHPDGSRRLSMRSDPGPMKVMARRSVLGKIFPGIIKKYLLLDADPEKRREVDWVVGGCFMIRRDFFLALGGFDERFFLFFEDSDLCRKARVAGKKVVYFPDVTVMDRPRRLSGESFWDLFSKIGRAHMVSAVKYFWKWGV